jgi:Zn-dependent protease with chaperone function
MTTTNNRTGDGAARPPRRPSSVRLLMLVVEGYAYIALVVAVLLAVPALILLGLLSRRPFVALIAVFVGVPLLLVARTAVRALLFRIPAPDGVRVTAADAPLLHGEIATLREATGAPGVHEVRLVSQFNASVVQRPRFVIFWPRNYLLIGFPLFAALSPDQMRAVIAHELAHLSRAHGQLALLVHRLRLSWARLLQALDSATPTFAVFLLRWYGPRLRAHSSALARDHEFLVDRLAAHVAGAQAIADSVILLGVVGPLYEDALWDQVEGDEADEAGPFSRPLRNVWPVVATEGPGRLDTLLSQTTDPRDTHPALSERLAAIAANPRVPPPPDHTAADVWLGAHKSEIAAELDQQWAAEWGKSWQRQRDERRSNREQLVALERVTTPSPAQLHEKARLVEALDGTAAALPLYEQAAEAGDAGAALAVGRVRLDGDVESGVALIEQAVAGDASLGEEGHRLIVEFFQSRGRLIEANRYLTLAQAAATRATLAANERREMSPVDRFGAHGLDQPVLDRILASLARTPEIHAAFMVRKELRYSAGTQLILAVDANGAPPSLGDRLVADRVVPEDGIIVTLGRVDGALRQALGAVPGAAIYRR